VDFLFIDASGFVKFWHYPSSKCLQTISENPPKQCLCSSFSAMGDRLAVGGADPAINIYDTQTKELIRALEPRWLVYIW